MDASTIIIIILIIYFICEYLNHTNTAENFAVPRTYDMSLLDSKYNQILGINKMLTDIDTLFTDYKVTYWITNDLLLDATFFQRTRSFDQFDIAIDHKSKKNLEEISDVLYQSGYYLIKFWGGFRIYPFSGVDIKNINYEWNPRGASRELEDQNFLNYLTPYVNIFIYENFGKIYHYYSRQLRQLWGGQFFEIPELFPLKRYQLGEITLFGPNDPYPYLKRTYPEDLGFHQELNRWIPLVKSKVKPTREQSMFPTETVSLHSAHNDSS